MDDRMVTTDCQPLYTIEHVAERLSVSTSTVYRLVASGRIGHLRIGLGRGAIRFSDAQIQSYLQGACRGAAAPPPPPRPKAILKHIRL